MGSSQVKRMVGDEQLGASLDRFGHRRLARIDGEADPRDGRVDVADRQADPIPRLRGGRGKQPVHCSDDVAHSKYCHVFYLTMQKRRKPRPLPSNAQKTLSYALEKCENL